MVHHMAATAFLATGYSYLSNSATARRRNGHQSTTTVFLCSRGANNHDAPRKFSRRDVLLKSSEVAVLGAIFNFSGKKPEYLGVQRKLQALALCPATKTCISTSENIRDVDHYIPPWNYNAGRKKRVSRDVAFEELLQVVKSRKLDNSTPMVVEQTDDYVRVEYQSPILGLVDDVEFWFPPEKESIVEYRSASRLGIFDFDGNRKRIKALRTELEKKGWASQKSF